MTSIKQILGLCGLASALALASGCSDYTYFNVDVGLRISGDNRFTDDRTIDSIVNCSIAVFIGDKQIENSTKITTNGADACRPGKTVAERKVREPWPKDRNDTATKTYDLGVLDYSTARQSGRLKFVVTMQNDQKDIAQGWVEAEVSSGKVLSRDLIVDMCPVDDGCEIKNIK